MALKLNIPVIDLDGTGTEIPTLNITDHYQEYLIRSFTTAVGNYAINPTGTPTQGDVFVFDYSGALDITTNGTTFSIFGRTLTQNQLNTRHIIKCVYDGSSWIVYMDSDIGQNIIETDNIVNGAVTNAKLATNSVSTANIQSNAVTFAKVQNINTDRLLGRDTAGSGVIEEISLGDCLAFTGAQQIEVSDSSIVTVKIADNNVTDAKIADGSPASVRIRDASGVIQDLPLANNEIAIGNGTTVVAQDLYTLLPTAQLLYTTLTISSADVLTLNSVPINFIGAVIGKTIQIVSANISVNYNSAPYATNTQVSIITNNATTKQATQGDILLSTVSTTFTMKTDIGPASPTDTQLIAGEPVLITVDNGDPTGGDSTITIRAWYQLF